METIITVDILEKAGFSRTDTCLEREHFEKEFYVKDYSSWMCWTSSEDGFMSNIKIDFQKGIIILLFGKHFVLTLRLLDL